MKRRLISVIVVAVVCGGGVLAWRTHNSRQASGILTLYGNVDIRRVDLSFRVGGRVADVVPTEGTRVPAGAVVARLDGVPYDAELRLAEARRDEVAAAALKLERGYRPEEIAQAEAQVRERTATLQIRELEERRAANLLARETISRQAHDAALTGLKEAQARLAAAEEGLLLVRRGYRAEELQAARAALQAARARVATAETRCGDTLCRAPAGGTVLTRVQEPGAVVAPGQTVITLSLDEPAWVRAYLAEPELGWVRPGLKAEILTDSRPGRPIAGHVGYVSSEAEFTPKTVQTEELRTRLVYQVRIIADESDPGLRQGMPVTVRLVRPAAP